MPSEKKITANVGFIGAGNMAKAIGIGLLKSDMLKSPSQLYASAPTCSNLKYWQDFGVHITQENSDIVMNCEIVFLSVKPQYAFDSLKSAYKDFSKCSFKSTTLVSILAGTSVETLQQMLADCVSREDLYRINIVRSMPNTPIFVGQGCTVYCAKAASNDDNLKKIFDSHVEDVKTIFSVNGLCEEVSESLINPIGALSGSGPAYVFQMIEALSDGGVKLGVPRDLAIKLAAQTLLGAAKMVLDTGKHPGQLKDDVCSAGGTTICGIAAMERQGVRFGLISAIEAAYLRSEEMGKKK